MFEKNKAMRSAERYLSQGKIRDAIGEYRQVVENDPRDIITLNMLGDLHSKNSDVGSAVKCYMNVADHYNEQGFSQKAIAIYNKITRLQPNSLEVSQKLAELYKAKGSAKEAKSHYATLAEHYNSQGRRTEALEIWNEIAGLDPNNTEVYLTIADAYLQEERLDDAADAFCKAGERFILHSRYADAVEAFEKVFGIDPKFGRALQGYFEAKLALDKPEDAIEKIELLLVDNPLDRELLTRLADAQIRSKDTINAEKTVLRLVEVDPSSYLKCLELSDLYKANSDIEAAIRMLTIASEHMLVGGQAAELQTTLEQIDTEEPDRLDVVRLLARFCAWQKDDEYLRTTLVRLNGIAAHEGAVDDERYALSQLVMLMPQEAAYAERLKAINLELGISEYAVKGTVSGSNGDPMSLIERNGNDENSHVIEQDDFAIVGIVAESDAALESEPEKPKKKKKRGKKTEDAAEALSEVVAKAAEQAPSSDAFLKEVESIRFYIENGYNELAEKAVAELREVHGERPELQDLLRLISSSSSNAAEPAIGAFASPQESNGHAIFDLGDLRTELGLEDLET
ncbi:MAG: tetratricopeptide repeat protein, partial [Pyrinomonadaceae bacterium]